LGRGRAKTRFTQLGLIRQSKKSIFDNFPKNILVFLFFCQIYFFMNFNPEIIGIAAGVLTTVAFLPQVIKTWKSRSAKELSLGMFLLFFLGICLWLVYGLIINDLPMILANGVTLVLAGILLVFKLTFKN